MVVCFKFYSNLHQALCYTKWINFVNKLDIIYKVIIMVEVFALLHYTLINIAEILCDILASVVIALVHLVVNK